MSPDEARAISQSVVDSKSSEYKAKEDELTDKYYNIAKSFIKEASEKGKFDTGLCYRYDEEFVFDRKHQELYEWAIQRVGFKLRQEGFQSSFHHNRAIKTMGLNISWNIK